MNDDDRKGNLVRSAQPRRICYAEPACCAQCALLHDDPGDACSVAAVGTGRVHLRGRRQGCGRQGVLRWRRRARGPRELHTVEQCAPRLLRRRSTGSTTLSIAIPKPYIALMDGIVMGGGMGIAQGASLRVVTDRTRMAMPEVGIGFFPDVGASYFLSRLPAALGAYLGLSGVPIRGADALYAGLADVYLPPETLDTLDSALAALRWAPGPFRRISTAPCARSGRRRARVDSGGFATGDRRAFLPLRRAGHPAVLAVRVATRHTTSGPGRPSRRWRNARR